MNQFSEYFTHFFPKPKMQSCDQGALHECNMTNGLLQCGKIMIYGVIFFFLCVIGDKTEIDPFKM